MKTTTFQILSVDPSAQFVVWPFEHRGAKFEARPLLAVRFDALGATFELKPCREWLFFRDQQQPEAVFAIPTVPLGLSSPQDAAQWLELALESGQFHRFLAMEDAHPYLEGPFLFFFGCDGRGFVREPWDDDGPAFEWSEGAVSTPQFLGWPREDLERFVEQQAKQRPRTRLWDKLFTRDISDEARTSAPLEWLCGSHEELAVLTRALLHSQSDFWDEASRTVALHTSESEYGRAKLYALFRFFGDGQSEAPLDKRLQTLSDLFLDFNTPLGHSWEFQDAYGGRASWEPQGREIEVHISAPTSHERLEAHLFLRDWLRGKVPADQIAEILSHAQL